MEDFKEEDGWANGGEEGRGQGLVGGVTDAGQLE